MADAVRVATLVERVMGRGLVLQLVDPAPDARGRVRSRAYAIGLQPALWGGTDLIRSWGRRGHLHRPRLLATHHLTDAELRGAVAEVVRLRLRHGYVPGAGAS